MEFSERKPRPGRLRYGYEADSTWHRITDGPSIGDECIVIINNHVQVRLALCIELTNPQYFATT